MASSICELLFRAGRARRRGPSLTLLFTLVAGSGWPPRVAAEEASRNVADQGTARAHLLSGVAQLKSGDFAAALAEFQAAYALVPSPKIKYDLGLAYLGLHRNAEALAAFSEFLVEAPDAPADKRALAERYRADLQAQEAGEGRPTTESVTQAFSPPPPVQPLVGPGAPVLRLNPAEPPPPLVAGNAVQTAAPAGRRLRVWAVSSAATGLLLVGTGATFGLLAKKEGDSLTQDSQAGGRTFDPAKESSGLRDETIRTILLVGGCAALAAGAVLFVEGQRRPATSVTKVAGRSQPTRPAITAAAAAVPGFGAGTVKVSF